MNRDFLKEQGLNDEQIEAVMREYGKSINDYKEKAEQADGLQSQIDDYKEQIKQRDEQLDELSKQAKDNEELTAEIERLKEENKTTADEFQEKLNKQAFDFTLERALNKAGAKNEKAVKALLDVESIKLDGDTLLGLDDQLKGLKESDEYLFQQEEEEKKPKIVNEGNPKGGAGKEEDPFSKILAKYK